MTQKEAIEVLKSGRNVFLTGQAGSGKTHVLSEYIKFLRNKNIPVGVTASTGIAATHLNGITIHSWTGMGINSDLSDKELKNIVKKSYLKKRISKAKVLIIDEISMLSARHFDIANQIVRQFKGKWEPFGGIQIILSGDFFQLPPIGNITDEKTGKFAYYSSTWEELNMKVCYLTEQWRQNDKRHIDLLNSIRENRVGDKEIKILKERIVDNNSIKEITKLYTHNIDVDKVNEKQLSFLDGEEKTFHMNSFGQDNIVNALYRGCLAPQVLSLKKGALVMFVRNNFNKGFVNGTIGTVINFDSDDYPIVRTKKGKTFIVTPEKWKIENEEGKTLAEIEQLPLRLAWAITIHKSQGTTLDNAEIDLSKCFEPGMGYVALSRVKSLENIYLQGFNEMSLKVREEVVEIDKRFQKLSLKVVSEIDNNKNEFSFKEKKKKNSNFSKDKKIKFI